MIGFDFGIWNIALQQSAGPVEINPNPDFDGQSPYVVTGEDATHTATFENGTMRYQSDTTSPVLRVTLPDVLEAGTTYRITTVTSAYVGGVLKVAPFDDGGLEIISDGLGTKVITGVAGGTSLDILRNTPDVDITLASFSIVKV